MVDNKDEVVIVMPDEQLDTHTFPEADTMLVAQLDTGNTRTVIAVPEGITI